MTKKVFIFLALLLLPLSVLSQSGELLTDTPQRGEGLGAFLLRNGLSPAIYKDEFVKLNSTRLGKDYSLRLGVKYTLPRKLDNVVFEPLFGEQYKLVTVEDHRLDGAVFYLVSGHGGPDPGAMAKSNGKDICEDEYAYDVVLRLARQLISWGAKVHIIIQDKNDGIRDDSYLSYDNDETCLGSVIPLDQIQRLKQRSDAINNLYKEERSKYKYARAIIVHLDSRGASERIDIFLYHFTKSVKGERLARTMLSKFEEKYRIHQPLRGFAGTVSERGLYVLKMTNPPAVFLELGNIQNSLDCQRFLKTSNREAMAKWMAEGIYDDFRK